MLNIRLARQATYGMSIIDGKIFLFLCIFIFSLIVHRERGVPNSTAVFHDAHDPTTKKKKTRFRKNGGNGDAVKNG